MMAVGFETVDVFTDRRFGGNPLAVFPDAGDLSAETMQLLAAEMNLSETTFVLPPGDPANSARVRIFNRTAEMAFAGHPMIGTGYVLAGMGLAPEGHLSFEIPAGIARVTLTAGADGRYTGGTVEAPQTLQVGDVVPPAIVASCLGLVTDDVDSSLHDPLLASMGNPYVIAQLKAGALSRCIPDLAAFRRALADRSGFGDRFSLHVYERTGGSIRARMFAPLAGTWEDPATGSANAPLGALLLQRLGGDSLLLDIEQGAEMGRPSRLRVESWLSADGYRSRVSGMCVPVFSGSFGALA